MFDDPSDRMEAVGLVAIAVAAAMISVWALMGVGALYFAVGNYIALRYPSHHALPSTPVTRETSDDR